MAHDLTKLEDELRRVYSQLAAAGGLAAATQALGRLMCAPPPVAPELSFPTPAASIAAAAAQPAALAQPASASTPFGPASVTAHPESPSPSATKPTTSDAHHASVAPISTSLASTLPMALGGQASPARSPRGFRTLESIHTMPSATLSQMPSEVLSLVSPSEGGDDQGQSETEKEGPSKAAPASGAGEAGGRTAAMDIGGKGRAAAVVQADLASSPASSISVTGTPKSGSLWARAIHLSKGAVDPWASRNLPALPMERAMRQRYNPHTGTWLTDEVLIKIESKPFAAGAMRECFAAKQLSTFTHSVDWHKATNIVAKNYKKQGVRKSVYYNDVLVQMDAKMLGEMYNRTDPPKQVDVMQCAILQFTHRPKAPLYCIEQLIEGDYVKYNSNSGFVQGDELLRNTPHAFSHFTWELTKGLKICVDVQGVGDLYTDPQLHTLDGEGYGEGNLGVRGMGLFFRTHECNALCRRLGLKPLERCDADVRSQGYSSSVSSASASGVRGGGRSNGTMARTLARTISYKQRMAADRKKREEQAAASLATLSEETLLGQLKDVPKESPEALVHMEIAKLYGEVVLLPELKPAEDPEDCLHGGLFHVHAAARCGSLLALLILARAHCGIDATAPQFTQLFKVGQKLREWRPFVSVAWCCVQRAAEAGVRGAALAVAHAYGTGSGLLADEALGGEKDAAKAAKWYAAALALPDVLAEAEEGGEGGDKRTSASSGRGAHPAIAEDDEDDESEGPEMSGVRPGHGKGGSESDDDIPQMEAIAELELRSSMSTNLQQLRVPKLEELKPSRAFLARLKLAVEEEASALPGASVPKYEIMYNYGCVLLEGGEGLEPNPTKAWELLNSAAEEAGAAGKGRLAQKYFEKAAEAEGMCEE